MAKLIGYILALIGILAILASFNISKISFLASFNKTYVLIAGIVLVILGVAFLMGKGKKQIEEEVPIYHGKKIVGYRKAK